MSDERLRPYVDEFGARWGEPGLEASVRVVFSSRLRSSLGRATPARGSVRINAHLRDADPGLLREVVGHELAHVLVYRRHGRVIRPHGAEWQTLMRDVGLAPQVSRSFESVRAVMPAPRYFEHRCARCGPLRVARVSYRRWRCARCVAAGRHGELDIAEVAPR